MPPSLNPSAANPASAPPRGRREKLAILGGGPSALACAYSLTSRRALREKYDITIYSMGWKLGGKGSSGRGPDGRIEEHGLHVLFGAYHSFFATMRETYEELDRPAGHPMRTWRDAFKGDDFGVVEDYVDGEWHPWAITFPRNDAIPGERGVELSSGDYLTMAFQGAIEMVFGWRTLHDLHHKTSLFDYRGRRADGPDLPVELALRVLKTLIRVSHDLAHDLGRDKWLVRTLRWLRAATWPMLKRLSGRSVSAHRFWLGLDFIVALLSGIVEDGVLLDGGFDAIDRYDFREWLMLHGAHRESVEAPFGRTIYDAAFSYVDGEAKNQRIAAGVAVHILLGFGMYRGSMYYKMQAGMGDTVFAPLYQLLKRRGVKFEFFNKVESLHLSSDRQSIERVAMTRQAELEKGRTEYQPLFEVKGLECWPSEPLYDQLADGEALRGINFESYYEHPPNSRPFDLEAGKHFDKLLFAIPIGAVPILCKELIHHSPRWKDMVQHVKSVQTAAFQIWLKEDLPALGWQMPPPLLSLYVEPLNTWSDMSQVLPAEDWPAHLQPKSVHYFCGPQPGPDHAPDPKEDPDFEKHQYAAAKQLALQYVRHGLCGLLPKSVDSAGPPPRFNWNLLVDPGNGIGEGRFDRQYWRSNCGPSERCTLALPGSTQYRMPAGDTGYANLAVTGDWIDNGIYAASMEGAFNAGILAARAISGWDFPIDSGGYGVTRGPLHPRPQKK